jgi:conjugative relaxase-like TrwC/TraI family protein
MLRASPPLTVGQASHYYKSEFSRGDYYTERESEGIVASRWHGRGAEQLGLSGRVKADHFQHLLEGRDSSGEHVLVAHREGLSERRAGWDVTVSPHSVSLQALVGGDSRLLEAHDRAVEKALSELERHAQAWVHGGHDVVTTGNVVAASFRHETSRALDPQLHSHCVVLNITCRVDGEWRAINARGIFRAQRLCNEVYQAELRRELVRLGYEVQTYKDGRSGRQRVTGIAGFHDEHLKQFSKRSHEIERELNSRGLRSARHAERVTLSTRKAKGIDREVLLWNWRTAAREAGLQFPKCEKERLVAPTRLGPVRELELSTLVAVSGAVAHLTERRAVFGLSELEREALSRGRDRSVTIDDVRKEIFARDDLVVADRSDAVLARVTTSQAIEDERAVLQAVVRGRGRGPTLSAPERTRGLGEDQLRVARHILSGPDRLLAVEGKAGAGKTTTLAYVRDRAEEAGWTVRGFAPTTTATAVLREGGIESVTVAAALEESPAQASHGPQLWIVDEAGLLSNRQARELVDRAERVGAKVVLVGDRQQHHAVEAGSPFALMIDRAGIATERLDVIRRQRDEQLRETVRAASKAGDTARAVQLLEQAGRVVEIPDRGERHEAIARDFVADGGRGVVIAPSNAERTDLNRRVREALIEAGRVERKSIKASVVVRQDLTAEQRGRAESYNVGDVLRFVRGGGRIEAGERARVVSLDERWNLLRLQLESSGLVRVINPKERRAFEVERVEQRRFAVGDRIQFRERDRSLDVANGTVATIKKLDHERALATVEVAGRSIRLDLKEPKALDHAYAVTSHRSQGLSRERVYLTVDTSHSEELVNRRQFYVGVSRAVEDARVYTDDRMALVRAVSREQDRESALQIADRIPKESRIERPRWETALDLVRSSDERRGAERGDGRAAGGDRRGQDADRGRQPLGRGAEGPTRPARGASGPERGRVAGAHRVPGQGDSGRAQPGRGADPEAQRGRGKDRPKLERPYGADAEAPGRGGRAAVGQEGEERALADGRLASGDAARGLPGRPAGQLPLWRDGEAEAGRRRGDESHAQEERARGAAPAGGLEREAVRHPGRTLSRDEIARSAELQRRYAQEYASMLRVVSDREVAKEAARVNVSALLFGQPRIVPSDRRVDVEQLREAIARIGEDLDLIRRGISRLMERAAPEISRLRPPRGRDFGPER